MRKVGIALVVLVVIAVLATPLVGGILARKAHAVLVQNLGQVEVSSLGTMRLTSEGFDLGWLSSKARMKLEVGSLGSSWSFPLVHVIHHGPLPVAHAARGLSAAVIDTTIEGATLPDGKVPFRGETVIGMTGDLGVALDSLALPRRQDVAWEGGSAQLRVSDQGKRIAVQANAPRLELHGAPGDVVLESLKVDYSAESKAGGPSLGSAAYALGRMRVTSPGQRNLAVDGFSWSSNAALNPAGNFDSSYVLRLAALDLDDRSYRNLGFDLWIRNLDAAAANALNEIGREVLQVSASGMTSDQIVAQVQAALMLRLPSLLGASPEIEVKGAHVETLDGRIDADLRVMRDPSAASTDPKAFQAQGKIVLPLPAFAALTLRAASEISPAAVQNNDTQSLDIIADQIAEQLLTRGYVREEEDGRLSTEFSYGSGGIVLNGETLNLGELLMVTGGLPR